MIAKKGDGSQVKESTDSSTTIEDDDVCKGESLFVTFFSFFTFNESHSLVNIINLNN